MTRSSAYPWTATEDVVEVVGYASCQLPEQFNLLRLEQLVRGHSARVLEGLALDRVANRPHQAVRVDPTLDQIVLRALLQGLDGKRLVVEAAKDDKRDVRGRGVGAPHSFQALGVGQSEVKENEVDPALGEMLLGLAHALDVRQLGVLSVLFAEHLAEQPSVSGIIFDDEEKPPDVLGRLAPDVNRRLPICPAGNSDSIVVGHLPLGRQLWARWNARMRRVPEVNLRSPSGCPHL